MRGRALPVVMPCDYAVTARSVSDDAIQILALPLDCFASLAMT